MKLYLTNVDKKLSCGYFLGNTLTSVLDSVAVVCGQEGTNVGGKLQVGQCGYAFLRVLRMALYFKNSVLSQFCESSHCGG